MAGGRPAGFATETGMGTHLAPWADLETELAVQQASPQEQTQAAGRSDGHFGTSVAVLIFGDAVPIASEFEMPASEFSVKINGKQTYALYLGTVIYSFCSSCELSCCQVMLVDSSCGTVCFGRLQGMRLCLKTHRMVSICGARRAIEASVLPISRVIRPSIQDTLSTTPVMEGVRRVVAMARTYLEGVLAEALFGGRAGDTQ